MIRNIRNVLLLSLLLSAMAWAQQTTGDILGTVTDNTGAVVAGGTVTVENLGTGEKRVARSSNSGEYTINLLNPGEYKVTITSSGFRTFTVPTVRIFAGDRRRLDAQLEVGQTSEVITVEATTSALQTDSSVLSNTVESKATQDLPLNGRNYIQLVQLMPGANEGPPDSLTNGTKFDDRRQTSSISVNGQSDVMNNQMIDGVDNNERLIGTIGVRPSVESIAEMRVQTNTYTAEAGRTGGGIINVITKSGSNQFHGAGFEYLRNDIFDASNYFFKRNSSMVAPKKSALRQNQFGGSIGGPIQKDKTFFFGDYEGYKIFKQNPVTTTRVPNAADKASILAHMGSVAIDRAGQAYFDAYPTPNAFLDYGDGLTDLNAYQAATIYHQKSHAFDIRVDHNFNATNMMFARYTFNKVDTNAPGEGSWPKKPFGDANGPALVAGGASSYATSLDYNAMLNYVHTFTPNLLLELKAAYTRVENTNMPATRGTNPHDYIGQPNVNSPISDNSGLALMVLFNGKWLRDVPAPTPSNPNATAPVYGPAYGGMGDVIFQPLMNQDNTFQYVGSLIWNRGSHSLKFGGSVIRRQLNSFQSSFGEGLFLFTNVEELLKGTYFQSNRSLALYAPYLRLWEPGFYVQDDWRVNNKLTVNLGLRYDVYTPFTEKNNHISNFNPYTGQLMVAGVNGVDGHAGIRTDYSNIQPRAGFAYSVSNGLVVRGGFGMSFFPMNTTSTANLKNPPFTSTASCTSTPLYALITGNVLCGLFYSGFPAITPTNIDTTVGASITAANDPKWHNSYLYQYNLTVQKDWSGNVVTLSYVGSLGRHLAQYTPDLNAPGATSVNPTRVRPYGTLHPALKGIGFTTTGGNSSYNSLQASFSRRFSKGLGINANYSWAHNLDNATGLSQQGSGAYGQRPLEMSTVEYGNSQLDIRQRIAVSANYELPFGKSMTGIKAGVIKGWQMNLIGAWSTGSPFTIVNNSTVSNAIPGTGDRPDQVGDPMSNVPDGLYFNPAAFHAQTSGTYGSERRNQLHGPSFKHVDLSLFKVFPIREQIGMEFRAECFNLTNTVSFANPNASLGGGPDFGVITGTTTNYQPRVMQFALKLRF